ncbi:hypothetical protein ACBY01_13840 [Sphingomonas sp. ac-8]|uniref:hypothetical protein n=1 Tax=Sphingomonas sp. ac-8 TaxID=3242977 RepID=UPI003A7F9F0E
MNATVAPRRLIVSAASAAAVCGGGAVALIVLLLPTAWIEAGVRSSGLPGLLAAAEPPLGLTARIALLLLLGGLAAAVLWGLGRLAFGRLPVVVPLPRRRRAATPREVAAIPVLRRGDAHPDAPARAPVLAMRDLGTPFLEVTAANGTAAKPAVAIEPVEQPLPQDLDQPMAAFDPQAVPAPLAPPVRPLFRIEEAGDDARPATPLVPQIRAGFAVPPVEEAPPLDEASNQDLLARLERGLARREQGDALQRLARGGPRDDTLQATLASLRNWAATG